MSLQYPYSRQEILDADITAVENVLRSTFLTQGSQGPAFEAALAKATGAGEVAVCANGTAALHLAYATLGLGPKRGLITSPITFLATANAARLLGAPVLFADVDPATGNLDPEALRRSIEESSVPLTAVAPVHMQGRPCAMPEIADIARAAGLMVVEDAAHALGSSYRDSDGKVVPIGACAHSEHTTLSFHAIKHVAAGEGGAVTGNDKSRMARIRLLRNHGMTREGLRQDGQNVGPWSYEMHEVGWNYRLSDIQCALGLSQLARLESSIVRRRAIAERYTERLAGINCLKTPPLPSDPTGHAFHLYSLSIDFKAVGKSRGEVMQQLADRGIGTQVHYTPLYRQPYYSALGAKPLPGAEQYYARTLSIPMYAQLTIADVDKIATAIREVLAS